MQTYCLCGLQVNHKLVSRPLDIRHLAWFATAQYLSHLRNGDPNGVLVGPWNKTSDPPASACSRKTNIVGRPICWASLTRRKR